MIFRLLRAFLRDKEAEARFTVSSTSSYFLELRPVPAGVAIGNSQLGHNSGGLNLHPFSLRLTL
jgi:hypothetical protein